MRNEQFLRKGEPTKSHRNCQKGYILWERGAESAPHYRFGRQSTGINNIVISDFAGTCPHVSPLLDCLQGELPKSQEEISSSGKRTKRLGAAITPPETPHRNAKQREPEQEAWARFRQKKNQRQEAFERIAKAIDRCVAELRQDRRCWRVELSFVLFG